MPDVKPGDRFGADAEVDQITRVVTTAGLEVIKTLRRGDTSYLLTLIPDNLSGKTIVRFTHK